MTDRQRLEALAARRKRAGAMIDVAEILGVEEVGRTRRDVGKADESARPGSALGERRHLERAAGGAAHVIAEVGLADIAHGEARPSANAMRLPCRPCRAGWQPVATEAAETRVTDGKTAW